ncbi:dyslexia-associated protein KIAA0319 homolog [Anoplopoma fimbria]|uniref:dyslexia-associated protein KIAA0319 homolog n=1 Tax=Anoplopoma fimbria TaxID=229290 RepID=UPI0023EB80F3|nr:dyslexia-associated protein KIAA0319 homolog [Anoplopoma fimbria]XP_054483319.1 dyslexia-associated protein KIAA0319 homolog [Anoplopoma fimbria]
MWEKTFLLLLHSVEAVVTSQCWQGATFSEAVVSPAVKSGGILRVPGVASLPQCVAACCDLLGYDLAWLFEGRCYILRCQQTDACRPQERPGADSFLAFLQRASPETLVLQSLVRGEPYAGRWRPPSQSSEAPGDLEALKDLALFDGPPLDFSGPGMLDAEYLEGSQEERGGPGSEERNKFNQSEAEDGPEGGRTESSVAQNRASSGGNISQGDNKTWRPTDAAEKTTEAESSIDSMSLMFSLLQQPTTVSPQRDHIRTSLPTPATPHWLISSSIQPAADRPLVVSGRNPVEPTTDVLKVLPSAVRAPPAATHPPDRPLTSDLTATHPPDRPLTSDLTATHPQDGPLTSDPTTTHPPDRPLTSDLTTTHPPDGPLTSDPTTTHPPDRPLTSDLTTTHPPDGPLTSDPTTTHPPDGPLTSDPTTTHPPDGPLTSDPTTTHPSTNSPTVATAEVRGSNRGPVAVVGPDRKLLVPVSSLSLDGGGSTADRGIVRYHWDAVSGPPGIKLEGADQAVATATGLRVGRYTFTLTVSDQQGATDRASLTIRVQEARSLPPVAHASGSHTVSLPNSSLVLRGSVTDGDQTEVHYLWVRDSQSPAAGDVLYGSGTQASLYLANLVEGSYLFQLKVTDAQGRSSTATATVEVRPDPGGGEEVELEMQVSVSQVSVAQRDTVVRQLAALIHVLDSDIQVRALQGHSHLSTVLRFSVQGPTGSISSSRLVGLLRNQLLREKSDYLLFRVLRVDTVLCLLRCSGRGQCDPITKECACDPFWTENLIRRYLGDGDSNCEWRVLYVILTSFMLMVFILSVSWTFICCCRRRRQTKGRRKTKYTILDNMDEQERVELRPKFSIKHRSTEHNSSLMMSESELDSDQDTVFSRDRPVRSRNRISAGAACNGNAFG